MEVKDRYILKKTVSVRIKFYFQIDDITHAHTQKRSFKVIQHVSSIRLMSIGKTAGYPISTHTDNSIHILYTILLYEKTGGSTHAYSAC
jgi:hypothetical protein